MLSKTKIKGKSKENESALRHKVRNLRAKVRLLLPMQLCCKQQKRSKNLLKMSYNKAIQQQQKQKRWCHCHQNGVQLFVPQEQGRQQKHLFHKLTSQQIQQIKEDKMYYLGEQFINEFDHFLQIREKVSFRKTANIMENTTTFKSPIRSIQEVQQRNWNWHKNSSSELTSQLAQEKHNKIDWHIRQMIKFESIKEKKKMIIEEDLTKRVYVKIRLRQKQERMRFNHEKAMVTKIQEIKLKNKLADTKYSPSILSSRNKKQYGEITGLSEKLRQICLARASKSANLLFRS